MNVCKNFRDTGKRKQTEHQDIQDPEKPPSKIKNKIKIFSDVIKNKTTKGLSGMKRKFI